jgi:hypothetical protein
MLIGKKLTMVSTMYVLLHRTHETHVIDGHVIN